MSTTNKLHNWLKVALAQREREAKTIASKYGNEAAKFVEIEVHEIRKFMAEIDQTSPDTPLEQFIKEKGSPKAPK